MWIGQNMIMVVSVLIRNLYYVQSFGLAYLRLGVFFFLIATILALFFLIIKVEMRKSDHLLSANNFDHSLLRTCYLLHCSIGIPLIASYNLNYNRNNLDTKFILHELSDKTLPILWKNKDAFGDVNSEDYQHLLKRIQGFKTKEQSHTWKSTTIMGKTNYQFFQENYVPQT